MRWLDGTSDSMHMSVSRPREVAKAREAWLLQSMGSQGVGRDLATDQQQ